MVTEDVLGQYVCKASNKAGSNTFALSLQTPGGCTDIIPHGNIHEITTLNAGVFKAEVEFVCGNRLLYSYFVE